jgi:NADPH2:quinone reductase
LLLVQAAKIAGARVIGTVSTEAKAQLAKEAGADEVILYTQADFLTEVNRLTDGRGVDVVYDSVGATTFDKSLDCLRPRGYLVLFGQSSGPVAPVNASTLVSKGSLFLTRPSLAHYTLTRAELLERASDLFNWTASQTEAQSRARLFIEDAAEAQRQLEARKTTGKVLLIP